MNSTLTFPGWLKVTAALPLSCPWGIVSGIGCIVPLLSNKLKRISLPARNFQEFLLGMSDSPRYFIPQTREKHRTELLADYWRQRWLLKRIEKPGVLDEVARHTCIYPIRHGAQVELPAEGEEQLGLWAPLDS